MRGLRCTWLREAPRAQLQRTDGCGSSVGPADISRQQQGFRLGAEEPLGGRGRVRVDWGATSKIGGSVQASDSPRGQDGPVCHEEPRRCNPERGRGAHSMAAPCSCKSWKKWALRPHLGDGKIEAPRGSVKSTKALRTPAGWRDAVGGEHLRTHRARANRVTLLRWGSVRLSRD